MGKWWELIKAMLRAWFNFKDAGTIEKQQATAKAQVELNDWGEGILQEKFSPADYTHFTGVDFSRVAIDRASAKALPNTTYLVGDLNALDVPGVFDVIIYNESIYYMDDPEAAIKRLLPQLAPGGIIIISQVDKHGKEQTAMWDLLNPTLDLAARNKVTNAQGYSWTIHVYKPRQ